MLKYIYLGGNMFTNIKNEYFKKREGNKFDRFYWIVSILLIFAYFITKMRYLFFIILLILFCISYYLIIYYTYFKKLKLKQKLKRFISHINDNEIDFLIELLKVNNIKKKSIKLTIDYFNSEK